MELVKLLTAGSYISIITWSMVSITVCRQQWKDLCVECKNIDGILRLPDSVPLQRTLDGSIRLKNAAFGWPVKPPTSYTVIKDTACTRDKGQQGDALLQLGEIVQSCQQEGKDSVLVEREDKKTKVLVALSALRKLPEPDIAAWPAPTASIA